MIIGTDTIFLTGLTGASGSLVNTLGYDLYYTPYTSFTGSLQTVTNDELETSKGACFVTNTDHNPCFSVTSNQEQCFFIADKEELPELPVTIEIPGFTEIIALSSHGIFELIVIGKYRAVVTDPLEEVMAKVVYDTSTQGGIGTVKGVLYVETLDNISITLPVDEKIVYEDIDRLECWDITTSLSPLAIIAGANVYWIDPVVFSLQDTNIGHTNASDAVTMPFFLEETYGKGTYTEALNFPAVDNPPYYILAPGLYWIYSWVLFGGESNPLGGHNNLNSHDYPYYTQGTNTTNVTANTRYLTRKQSDGTNENTDIGSYLGDNAPTTLLTYGEDTTIYIPVLYSTSAIVQQRKNVMISGDNRLVPNNTLADKTISTGKFSGTETVPGTDSYPGSIEIGQYYVYDYAFTIFDKAFLQSYPIIANADTGVNLCCDGAFAGIEIGGDIHYINTVGTISGTETASSDFTLIKGVALIADGTKDITQTVLE